MTAAYDTVDLQAAVVRAAQAVMAEADELNDGWIDEDDVTWLALRAALAALAADALLPDRTS